MKRFAIAFFAATLVVGCQENQDDAKAGSSGSGGAKTEQKSADSMTAKSTSTGGEAKSTAAGPIEYQEVRVGENVYVVGSKDAAEKARAGKLEKPVRAIGFGAPNEKVYFEEKNQAALEAEYSKRHPR
jgi:hypothetical protein